jgi:hypothetical protein
LVNIYEESQRSLTVTVRYPDLFPESLCTQLNQYFEKNKHSKKRISLMKRLIKNENMQLDVFPKLLKIKKVKIPETTIILSDPTPTNIDPIFLYLIFCIDLLESYNKFNPVNKTEHDNLFKQVIRNINALEAGIKKIQRAGISHSRCFIETSLSWQIHSEYLINMKISATHALKLEPVYTFRNMTFDNIGMSQRIDDSKDQLLICKLSKFTQILFRKPLHGVVANIANTLLNIEKFNQESVKMLLARFKKRNDVG